MSNNRYVANLRKEVLEWHKEVNELYMYTLDHDHPVPDGDWVDNVSDDDFFNILVNAYEELEAMHRDMAPF